MQQRALFHAASSVYPVASEVSSALFSDWPASSPYLNPIENLWSVIKKGLQGKDISTLLCLEPVS